MTKNWFQKMQDGFRQYLSDRPAAQTIDSVAPSKSKVGPKAPHQFLARQESSPDSFFLSAVDLSDRSIHFSSPRPLSKDESLWLDVILPRLGLSRVRAKVTFVKRENGAHQGHAQLELAPQQVDSWRLFISH